MVGCSWRRCAPARSGLFWHLDARERLSDLSGAAQLMGRPLSGLRRSPGTMRRG